MPESVSVAESLQVTDNTVDVTMPPPNVAGPDIAMPQVLLNTAWYCLLLSRAVMGEKVSVLFVPPLMLLDVRQPSALACHCMVGVGVPSAAAVKLAEVAHAIWFSGSKVTEGSWLTVTVALPEEMPAAHVESEAAMIV